MENLENNNVDYVTAAIKGGLGVVPFVGSALAEAFTVVIPNQRMDRFQKFICELNERIKTLEETQLRERLKNPERLEFLSAGTILASRAVSDERRAYLANLVSQGITKEKIEFAEETHFMRILEELNDIEVITLRYYLHSEKDGDETFRKRYQNIYSVPQLSMDSTDEESEKGAVQMSYRVHLSSLGLLRQTNIINKPGNNVIPPEKGQYKITNLGKLFLTKIGLLEPFEEKPNDFF